MKPYTITTLDRRHTGSHHFRYRIGLNVPDTAADWEVKLLLWTNIRNWCDDTWGHSCEVNIHRYLQFRGHAVNDRWAWLHRTPGMRQTGHNYFFFLTHESDLTMFELKW